MKENQLHVPWPGYRVVQTVTKITAHSLRTTAFTAMSDAGIELRYIMFMTGYRNESQEL